MITITRISDDESFLGLREAWTDLVNNNDSADVMQTWDWMYIWWTTFKADRNLWILAFHKDNKLIAIAPFLRREYTYYASFTFRRIELLCTGENSDDEICSDFLDILVEEGFEKEVALGIFNYFCEHSEEWDELYFTDVKDRSQCFKELFSNFDSKYYTKQYLMRTPCPYIDLPQTWDEFIRPKYGTRRNIKRKTKLIKDQGNVKYLCWTDVAQKKRAFNIMADLHQRRWESESKPGCFSSIKFRAFHEELFNVLFPKEMIKLYFLTVNDMFIACLYCLSFKDKLYGYQSGYEVAFPNCLNISPGFLLHAHCIEDAIRLGKKKYEFFKGTPGSYKYIWTSSETFVNTVRISKKRLLSNWLLIFIESMKKNIAKPKKEDLK